MLKPTIRNKVRLLLLGVSILAVAGSCGVFVAYLWFSTKSRLVQRQLTMATIVADQSTAAVEFDQSQQAKSILATLKAERQIVAAAIYTRRGGLFASYVRDGAPSGALPEKAGEDGQRFVDGYLLNFQPILSGGERVGTLHIRSDLGDVRERVLVVSGTALLVLLGAGLVVFAVSTRLAGLITGPVVRLSAMAHDISQRKDYSVRMEAGAQDEMGRLIDAFNEMLSQIQERDRALATARDELEKRVQERTRELEGEIAERKAAQQLIHEKDALLTQAQEIARLGSWEWHISTDKLSLSDEVYRLTGTLPSRLPGTLPDFLTILHPEDRALLRESMETACRKREPLMVDFRIILPDGAVRYLHAQGKVVLDNAGHPVRLVATLQDITERKLAEQSIQELNRELQARMTDLSLANKELEGFSYSVSHDLRAPLRAIDGYSRMLLEDFGDQAQGDVRRYLDVIMSNARRMGQLIDDLLSFSRMGRKTLESAAIDMQQVVKEVVEELKQQSSGRSLEFRIGTLPSAQGDPPMFRQVWTNLLSNAVKYTRGREPAVIAVDSEANEQEFVYSVRDNGVGFEMEFAHKLFGVFQRLHSTKDFEGTGVGLALVQRIVQRHGGRVWADSKVGSGATFYFALPRLREAGS